MDNLHIAQIPLTIIGVSKIYPAGYKIDWHEHEMGQFLHAISGTMRITIERECWLTPPRWGVWVPAGLSHSIEMINSVMMSSVYLEQTSHAELPASCQVIEVRPLLTELIQSIALNEATSLYRRNLRTSLLIEELTVAPRVPFVLPLGTDRRLRRAINHLTGDLASPITLDQLADDVGASGRTLMRLFKRETGLTFGHWRQRQRLIEALQLLAHGEHVAEVASQTGYTSVSAFCQMIRRATGRTPGSFTRQD